MPELGVWLHDEHIGTLRRTQNRALRFAYSPDVVDRYAGNAPLLSCSLPVGTRPLDARPFFEGLLPEGEHRNQIAGLAGVASSDAFSLLARYGRDIAGAVVVSATDVGPNPGDVLELDDADLVDEVTYVAERPLGMHDDSELSLAGLQDKLLLVRLDGGRWGRPRHGYPSTHILKLDHRTIRGVVAAEAACLEVARAAGLHAVNSDLVSIGDTACLVVERYDRSATSTTVHRIHQEDSCQALGRLPTNKYEFASRRRLGGGPELVDIANLLEQRGLDPATEKTRLLEMVTFNVICANADAHGKNVSVLHPTAESITLAPIYDVVPTGMWEQLNPDAAMTIGGRTRLVSVDTDALCDEARSWHVRESAARATVLDVAERVRAAADPEASPVAQLLHDRASLLLA